MVLDFFLTGYSFSNTFMRIFNLLPFPFWMTCPFLIFPLIPLFLPFSILSFPPFLLSFRPLSLQSFFPVYLLLPFFTVSLFSFPVFLPSLPLLYVSWWLSLTLSGFSVFFACWPASPFSPSFPLLPLRFSPLLLSPSFFLYSSHSPSTLFSFVLHYFSPYLSPANSLFPLQQQPLHSFSSFLLLSVSPLFKHSSLLLLSFLFCIVFFIGFLLQSYV